MSYMSGDRVVSRSLSFSLWAGCLLALVLLLCPGLVVAQQEPPGGWPDPDKHGLMEDENEFPADLEELPEGEPILEVVQSVRFDTPLILESKPHLLASNATHAFYLKRFRTLVAIDLDTGSNVLSEEIKPVGRSGFAYPERIYTARGSANDFVVGIASGSSPSAGALRVFSLAETHELELVGEIAGNEFLFADLPFDDLVLIDHDRAWPGIYDLKSMTLLAQLGGAGASRVAASKNPDTLMVATIGWNSSGGQYRALNLWDCSNPSQPARLPRIRINDTTGQLGIDPHGEWLFHTERDNTNNLTLVRIRNARTGELQSTLAFPGSRQPLVNIARGRSGAVLAVARDHVIELYDLQNPQEPLLHAVVEVNLDPSGRGWDDYWNPEPYWHASPTQPLLYSLDKGAGAVVAIDVDTGVQLTRWNPGALSPQNLALAEGAEGDELCVLSRQLPHEGSDPPRKVGVLHSLRVGTDGTLDLRSAYDEITPDALGWLETIGGRYLVGYDDNDTNALVSVDSVDGSVTDAIHPPFPDARGDYELTRFGAVDGSVLLSSYDSWSSGNGCWSLIPFEEGVFGEPISHCPEDSLLDALLAPGEIIYSLTREGLRTTMPDGEEGFLPYDFAHYFYELELSADSKRLLLSAASYGATGKYLMVDVEDPLSPRIMHGGLKDAGWHFRFVQGGKAFVTTFGSWFTYTPQLFDTETGEALGDPGETVRKWVYHGPGAAYGQDRLTFWHWTWARWETSVFDLSGNTPVLLGTSPFEHGNPYYAPRSGTNQAYLFGHEFTWSGPAHDLPTNTMLIGAGGEFTRRNAVPVGPVAPLRHGFLAMTPRRSPWVPSPPSLTVLRDPELNRPPVPDAGADQILECDDAGGSYATLDGRASYDPDSTPGTDDDIIEVRWDLDGGFAGDQLFQERWLAKGEHIAELTLRDRINAQATDRITISVQDTSPPKLTLELQPDITGNTWSADRWWLESHAADLCDGELVADHSLLLEEPFLAAEFTLTAADALQIVVRQGPAGLLVELHGDPAVIEPLWLEAQQTGRLTASKEQSLHLELTRPAADGVLAHYLLDEHGRLVSALSVTDHVLEAEAIDTEGLAGRAVRSLRQRITEFCEQLPANAICAGGSGVRLRSPQETRPYGTAGAP